LLPTRCGDEPAKGEDPRPRISPLGQLAKTRGRVAFGVAVTAWSVMA
jgi:hypothetical protein